MRLVPGPLRIDVDAVMALAVGVRCNPHATRARVSLLGHRERSAMTTAVPPTAGELTSDQLRDAYRVMRTIREFEERLHREFATGDIPGFVHLYAGEEAIAAGVIGHLGSDDYVASTHRGHGHAIAKGCDVKGMMAEIYGKQTGLCHGKGGSMHIADMSKGMLGANGIVGGGPPLVCGAALTARVKKTDNVAVSFTGDGGSNQGTFLESLNLASAWNLPAVFVVENNGYAESTPALYHQSGSRRGQARGRLRHAGRDRGRLRLLRRARGGGRGDRARPRRRRTDAARVQGHALLRPLRGRPADLPRGRRGRETCAATGTACSPSRAA